MNRFLKNTVLIALVFLVLGCSQKSSQTTNPATSGQSTWESGDSWRVKVTYWPERLSSPYTQESTKKRTVWSYKVYKNKKGENESRIIANNTQDTFLLTFNQQKNLLRIHEILERRTGYWKTRKVLSSPTDGKAFLVPSWQPDIPAFWIHPDLSSLDSSNRYRVSSEKLSGNWILQKIKKVDSKRKIILVHEPSKSRAIFHWKKGDWWWSEALFFKNSRLILRAEKNN